MDRIPYVPQLHPDDDLPIIADADDWFDLSVLDAATQQPPLQAEQT